MCQRLTELRVAVEAKQRRLGLARRSLDEIRDAFAAVLDDSRCQALAEREARVQFRWASTELRSELAVASATLAASKAKISIEAPLADVPQDLVREVLTKRQSLHERRQAWVASFEKIRTYCLEGQEQDQALRSELAEQRSRLAGLIEAVGHQSCSESDGWARTQRMTELEGGTKVCARMWQSGSKS